MAEIAPGGPPLVNRWTVALAVGAVAALLFYLLQPILLPFVLGALVAYLGDSSPEGLDRCPAMYEAMILITEMTFVARSHRRDKIHKYGHIHLDDIIERKERFHNELIVATHYSTRYTDERIHRIVSKRLPDMLDGRLRVWL